MTKSIIAEGEEALANAAAHSQLIAEYTQGKDIFNMDSSNNELESEEAARARLENLINEAKTLLPTAEDTPKKISNFDPAAMNVAKRSEQRVKAKSMEDEKDNASSSFKALPLPGNTPVKNDPLATTKSFEQKIGSVQRLIRMDNDMDSVVTSVASTKNDTSFRGYENEEEKEQARQIRAMKNRLKRNLLDQVNNIIIQEGSIGDDVSAPGGERVEDPSVLSQHIAQLESKLKHEKTQRLATLNDIADIDLNTIFDRLVAEDAGEDIMKIVDRLKEKVLENVHNFESYSVETNQGEQDFVNEKPPSLFVRQEEWVKRRDKKRVEAKHQLEVDTMRGVTGKPELEKTKRSWMIAKEAHEEALERAQLNATPKKVVTKDSQCRELKVIDWAKAKASHDHALKRATQQEEMKQKTKDEKAAATRVEEIQHLETSKLRTKSENKTPKKVMPKPSIQASDDRRKSSVQRIEQTRERAKLELKEEIFLPSKPMPEKDSLKENAFSGVSYSDMSEKEFKRLLRGICQRKI